MEIIEYVFTKQDVEIQADEQNSLAISNGFVTHDQKKAQASYKFISFIRK